jgi:hypothetical protein
VVTSARISSRALVTKSDAAVLGSQRNGWRGVNKLQTTDPIAAAIRTANAHVWNASLLLPWYIVRSRRTRNAPKRPRHPQCRGLLLSLAGQGCFFVHQLSYPKTSSPGHWPGLSIPDWMRECYIFGLQDSMTGAQIRAARGFLHWSVRDLGKKAKVPLQYRSRNRAWQIAREA